MTTRATGKTFEVSNVVAAVTPLAEERYRQAVEEFLGGAVESCSSTHGTMIRGVRSHPLIGTLHAAFCSHRPVSLSPDIIWLTICQGFAHHVNANAEALRHRLVNHEGTLKIEVHRDDLVKGSFDNPWPTVFAQFSTAIRDYLLSDVRDLVVADFSTTGPVERAASEVVLLDTLQAFFSYEVITICGIPSITLEGTADDWRRLAQRVRAFGDYGLEWWIEPLQDVCAQFVAAAEGDVDRRFWESIYKWNGKEGSGSPYVTGWIVKLFPYINSPEEESAWRKGQEDSLPRLRRNPWLAGSVSGCVPFGRDAIPCLPAKAPFRWRYRGHEFEMEFVAGPIGVSQNPNTFCLRPEIGWAVREALKSPDSSGTKRSSKRWWQF